MIYFIGGVITWTLLEYLIHRFLGHKKSNKGVIKKEHTMHHSKAHYFVPMYKKLALAMVVFGMSTLMVGLITSWSIGMVYSSGLASMYFLYELTHRRFHLKAPLIRYGLKMRKHHFYHHFGNPKLNHGVTTAFWDRVFRTYKKPEKVKVPQPLVMKWLLVSGSELNIKYKDHFVIR